MTATTSPVAIFRSGPVMEISLNRPKRRNAIDQATSVALAQAFDELDGDPQLRVGILVGTGGTFCAGMDLEAFARGERPTVAGRGFAGLVEAPPTTPLIAAVEGYALAGGLEVVLACDLVVAASDAIFGLPEVTRGLVAAGGGLLRLAERLPRALALELVLTGRRIDAEEAARWGLINRLTPPGEALDGARALAAEIAANAPLAVAASKQVIDLSSGWPTDEKFVRQRNLVDPVQHSEDALEGARAFLERREPVWHGR